MTNSQKPVRPLKAIRTFTLVRSIEFDLALPEGPDDLDEFAVRVDRFQSDSNPRSFRARILRNEHYRIQSTFPQDSTGRPRDHPSDELILVDWSANLSQDYSYFQADSPEDALRMILDDARALIDRAFGSKG